VPAESALTVLEDLLEASRSSARPADVAGRLCAILATGLPPWPQATLPRRALPRLEELVSGIAASVPIADLDHAVREYRLPIRLRHLLMLWRTEGSEVVSVRTPDGGLDLVADGTLIASLAELTAKVELTSYVDGVLTIDMHASSAELFGLGRVRYVLDVDGEVCALETTGEYAKGALFGHGFVEGRHLRAVTSSPGSRTRGELSLRAIVDVDGEPCSTRVKLTYGNSSHLASGPCRYWLKDGIRFAGTRSGITFARRSGVGIVVDEIVLWLRLLASPREHSRSDVVTRAAYFLTRPYFRRQHIWLTHDKMYSAGDCGELMYRYLESNRSGFTPYYAINANAPEIPRLRAERCRMVHPRTLWHRLVYLNAEVIFTTHQNPALSNGLEGRRAVNLRGLFNAHIVCIQHGLSMQGLAQIMRRSFAGIERYYCASAYEIANLSAPEYGYDGDQLRLTGIPRFDGLVSTPKHRVLVVPTWRPEYAAPPSQKGERRAAKDSFLDTPFFELYSQVLLDPRLLECARQTGYRIEFVLHPCIAANEPQVSAEIYRRLSLQGLGDTSVVRVLTAGPQEPYEKLLCEADLMVTDFSGVQYDHAYMGKPVVYFHPAEMPDTYEHGAMDYESMGFGEVVTTHHELVDLLCDYLRRGCAMEEIYRSRIESFFAFRDRNNCQRILADILDDPFE
jgi:hypothetical protein